MGSGRGKTRRVRNESWSDMSRRAILPRDYQPILEPLRWIEFFSTGGLEKVSLGKYYLGEIPDPMQGQDYVKIAEELLQDLLKLGVISIPKGVSPHDFTVRSEPGCYIIGNYATGRKAKAHFKPAVYLDPGQALDCNTMGSLMSCLRTAVQETFTNF